MLWAALLAETTPSPPSPARRTEALGGIAAWCLQWTPRVALVEPAVVMEVEASLRLFGGRRRLIERVASECAELGVRQLSWAPTGLAAVAFARAGRSDGLGGPLGPLLDALPVETITAVARHRETLARLGCRTLGHVRALPRGGLSRRFDAALLLALDQAYGLRPEVYDWVVLPETFHRRLELMARVELAPALLFGARRLLLQMCGWLAARRAGVTAITLRWCHDAMRSTSAGDGGELTVCTASPSRDAEHLLRLLAEHLARVELPAPVGDLELLAVEVQTLDDTALSLFPAPRHAGEGLALVVERISARLGPDRVLRPVLREDHRPEWMCHWQPAPGGPGSTGRLGPDRLVDIPQPTFMLPVPLRLAMRGDRPMYQGVLRLLAGPHRVEGGWWDRTTTDGIDTTGNVARDYWVALSDHAGVLWVFRTRLAVDDRAAWFLHGVFA